MLPITSSLKRRSYLQSHLRGYGPYCTIPEKLKLLSEQSPNKEAVIFVGESSRVGVTYSDIVSKAERIARKLVKIGIRKNDVVAINDDKSPLWLYCTFGAQMCGARPLHFFFSKKDGSDVMALLRTAKCKVLITQPGDADINVEILNNFVAFNKDEVRSETLPFLERIIFTESPLTLKDCLTLDKILPTGSETLPAIEPEDIAAILCSSGSSGVPKLIPWTHASLVHSSKLYTEAFGFESDSFYSDRSFSWVAGYPRDIINGIARVTNNADFKEKSVEEICDATLKIITTENCQHANLFSSTIRQLLKSGKKIEPIKTIITGGGPISSKDADLLGDFCHSFINLYGSSEIFTITFNKVSKNQDMINYDSGIPFPGTEVKIVNNDGDLAEVGTSGEIYVRSLIGTSGFLDEEQEWHKTNRTSGYWYKTGDAGFVSDNGHLFVTGRLEEAIIIEGAILYPSHFEDILMRNPKIEYVVAFAVPDEILHHIAGLAVKLKDGKDATKEEVQEFFQKERNLVYEDSFFASKFIPKKILFFDAFPLTSSGKIARKNVKNMALQRLTSCE
ncbi:hypothetical protein FSP39_006658 [Pinctada imbricata]|uniref:Uncharacterized protein n=1 Tax=Pinctada imbricata TaxID=66713 RepID=A0AA88Y1K2_PINIB|nr:hypothetical protein FSP39_006658 [Pinctada imbricata]